MNYLLYDTGFYGYRFAAGNSEDFDWGNGWFIHGCNHDNALNDFICHTQELLEAFPGYTIFLVKGDSRTFRHDLWPDYKANRKDRRAPAGYGIFLEGLTEYAKRRGWLCGGFHNVEDDDVLGICSTDKTVIVSGDKDLLTIPGRHYRDGELITVTEAQADAQFFKQALMGDATDGFPGCPGIGEKNKIFRSKEWLTAETPAEYWAQVRYQYEKAGFDELHAITMARLARILRPGEYDLETGTPHLWEPPVI